MELRISSDVQDAYYQSAAAEVKKWNADQKPTDIERVALALYGNGQRYHRCGRYRSGIHDLQSEKLSDGSNELIYALDDHSMQPMLRFRRMQNGPETRSIEAMLSFQNENGGFGLTGKDNTSVDMTAMALQALCTLSGANRSKEAIDRAVSCLKRGDA